MDDLKQKLLATVATVDGAYDMLDGNGKPKQFLIELYDVNASFRALKQWEHEQRQQYLDEMEDVNGDRFACARVGAEVSAALEELANLTHQVKLPAFVVGRATLEQYAEKNGDDANNVRQLLAHYPEKKLFEMQDLYLVVSPTERRPFPNDAQFQQLLTIELRKRVMKRVELDMLIKFRRVRQRRTVTLMDRFQELDTFVNVTLLPKIVKLKNTMRKVKRDAEKAKTDEGADEGKEEDLGAKNEHRDVDGDVQME